MSKQMIIRKANDLVEAHYKLTLAQQRILLFMNAQIQPWDEDFKDYNISVRDFCDLLELDPKGVYADFVHLTQSLIAKTLLIQLGEKSITTSWLCSAVYHKGKGMITLHFSPELKNFLLALKGHYTSYKLHDVRYFKSTYSFRLYELLKQYQKYQQRQFWLEDLKTMLQVQNMYNKYNDFKERVLLPAQKELKETSDIYFDFKEIKESRKVVKLEFSIHQNLQNSPHNIIDSTYTEIDTPPALEAKRRKPPKPREASQDEDLTAYGRQKILERMAFIEEPLSAGQRVELYYLACGDVGHIRRRYHETDDKDIKDLFRYLLKTIPMRGEDAQPVPKPRKASAARPNYEKKNRFVNFQQRENDHDELERLELEQFRQAISRPGVAETDTPPSYPRRKAEAFDGLEGEFDM
jgi:plasmid replication initiation protein